MLRLRLCLREGKGLTEELCECFITVDVLLVLRILRSLKKKERFVEEGERETTVTKRLFPLKYAHIRFTTSDRGI